MALADEVAEKYPSLLPLLAQPEIGKLLSSAVKNNWSPGKFQSKFVASRWFQTRSESQRRWWITVHTDKGEAKRMRNLMTAGLQNTAAAMGVGMTRAEAKRIREMALAYGVEADDPWVKGHIARLLDKPGHSAGSGMYQRAIAQMQAIGGDDYYETIPKHVLKKWGKWIIMGQKSIEDFQAAKQAEAATRHPHLAARLKAGETLKDIIDPMRQMVAEELELTGPDAVDMKNPKWRQLMGVRDPKSKKTRMLTQSEVLNLARQDGRWGNTMRGREAQYGMVRGLMETMGLRRF